MKKDAASLKQIVHEIAKLPEDWHKAGSVNMDVLNAIIDITDSMNIRHSAETGSGKTSLLFSHLSPKHLVFAVDAGNSISAVRESSLFNTSSVEFIEGPTQKTLPLYQFKEKFQLVMIDGPHGYPFPEMEYWHFYQQLETNAIFILDDIHIPTIYNMYNFLKEEEMFTLIKVVHTTAFFRRTAAEAFNPYWDGWWLQKYNTARFPIDLANPAGKPVNLNGAVNKPSGALQSLKRMIPVPIKRVVKKIIKGM